MLALEILIARFKNGEVVSKARFIMMCIFLDCLKEKSAGALAQYQLDKVTLTEIVLEGRSVLDPVTIPNPGAIIVIFDRISDKLCVLCGLADPDTKCRHCPKWCWHAACSEGAEVPCPLHYSSLWIRLLEKLQSKKCQTCDWGSAIESPDVYSSDLQYCGQVLKKNHWSRLENICIFSVLMSDAVSTRASWKYPKNHTLSS